jgi:hypothetical protein
MKEISETVRAAVNATTNEILGLKSEQKKQKSHGTEVNVPNCSLVERLRRLNCLFDWFLR